MNNEKKQITRAAGVIGISTLISRILGFIRDMVIAWFFGAGLLSDAFFVAFRLPNLFRRLFGEGSLTVAFVPVFSEYISKYGKEEAFQMARSAVRMLSAILVIITIFGIIAAPGIVRIIAPGFFGTKYAITVLLTRIMFPYVFFICLVALCMGILNVLGHFAAPALAPVVLNLSIIVSALYISPALSEPSIGLAIGVIIGGILQLLLQLPFLIQKKFFFWQKAAFFHPGLKKIGILMLPSVFGAAVYQINILVGTLLASLLAEGSVSYLYYADRLVQFPLGIFAISMSVAVLPSLSRQAASMDMQGLTETFSYAIRLIFFITLPATTGLIMLRYPIISLLFERGAFDTASAKNTADALLYFSVGLWAFSAVRIVVSTFYALQDTKTPVKTAVISILANIILGLCLMDPLAHGGLALATSLSSMLNFILLIMALRKKLGALGWKKIIESIAKSVICSFFMGFGLWAFVCFHHDAETTSHLRLLWTVTEGIIIGISAYGLAAYILKCRELKDIIKILKKG